MKGENMQHTSKSQEGFTLIELIIVIVVITILVAVVIIGINPLKRFQESRNATRWTQVNTIQSAIMRYYLDKKAMPANLAGTPISTTKTILGAGAATTCSSTKACAVGSTDCLDLTTALVEGEYLPSIPKDPGSGSDANTGFMVETTATGGVKVTACNAEDIASTPVSIFVQR